MKGMLLAAGLGTRLRPLTLELPKPATPVLGKPVISYNMEFLQKMGVGELVVNLHRIPGIIKQKIAAWGGYRGKVHYIIEPDILGTGGGIKNAEPFFNNEEFFVIANSDSVVSFDLEGAVEAHRETGAAATMIIFPLKEEKYTRVYLGNDGKISSIGGTPQTYTSYGFYTGFSILAPHLLNLIPPGKACLIRNCLIPAMEKGMNVMGYLCDGLFLDFGSPECYLESTFSLLSSTRAGKVNEEGAVTVEAPCFVGEGASIGEGAHIGPYASIESGAVVGKDSTVRKSILWEGSRIGDGELIEHSIVTPNRTVTCAL